MLLLQLERKPSLAPGQLQHWLFWLARGRVRLYSHITFSKMWRVLSDSGRASPPSPTEVEPLQSALHGGEGMDVE